MSLTEGWKDGETELLLEKKRTYKTLEKSGVKNYEDDDVKNSSSAKVRVANELRLKTRETMVISRDYNDV